MDNQDFAKKFPAKDYDHKEFNFSVEERNKVAIVETMSQYTALQIRNLEATLQGMMNQLLRVEILPRVGILDSKDIGISYDSTRGKFNVFIPKNKCVKCGAKADYEKEGKKYCELHLPK